MSKQQLTFISLLLLVTLSCFTASDIHTDKHDKKNIPHSHHQKKQTQHELLMSEADYDKSVAESHRDFIRLDELYQRICSQYTPKYFSSVSSDYFSYSTDNYPFDMDDVRHQVLQEMNGEVSRAEDTRADIINSSVVWWFLGVVVCLILIVSVFLLFFYRRRTIKNPEKKHLIIVFIVLVFFCLLLLIATIAALRAFNRSETRTTLIQRGRCTVLYTIKSFIINPIAQAEQRLPENKWDGLFNVLNDLDELRTFFKNKNSPESSKFIGLLDATTQQKQAELEKTYLDYMQGLQAIYDKTNGFQMPSPDPFCNPAANQGCKIDSQFILELKPKLQAIQQSLDQRKTQVNQIKVLGMHLQQFTQDYNNYDEIVQNQIIINNFAKRLIALAFDFNNKMDDVADYHRSSINNSNWFFVFCILFALLVPVVYVLYHKIEQRIKNQDANPSGIFDASQGAQAAAPQSPKNSPNRRDNFNNLNSPKSQKSPKNDLGNSQNLADLEFQQNQQASPDKAKLVKMGLWLNILHYTCWVLVFVMLLLSFAVCSYVLHARNAWDSQVCARANLVIHDESFVENDLADTTSYQSLNQNGILQKVMSHCLYETGGDFKQVITTPVANMYTQISDFNNAYSDFMHTSKEQQDLLDDAPRKIAVVQEQLSQILQKNVYAHKFSLQTNSAGLQDTSSLQQLNIVQWAQTVLQFYTTYSESANGYQSIQHQDCPHLAINDAYSWDNIAPAGFDLFPKAGDVVNFRGHQQATVFYMNTLDQPETRFPTKLEFQNRYQTSKVFESCVPVHNRQLPAAVNLDYYNAHLKSLSYAEVILAFIESITNFLNSVRDKFSDLRVSFTRLDALNAQLQTNIQWFMQKYAAQQQYFQQLASIVAAEDGPMQGTMNCRFLGTMALKFQNLLCTEDTHKYFDSAYSRAKFVAAFLFFIWAILLYALFVLLPRSFTRDLHFIVNRRFSPAQQQQQQQPPQQFFSSPPKRQQPEQQQQQQQQQANNEMMDMNKSNANLAQSVNNTEAYNNYNTNNSQVFSPNKNAFLSTPPRQSPFKN